MNVKFIVIPSIEEVKCSEVKCSWVKCGEV